MLLPTEQVDYKKLINLISVILIVIPLIYAIPVPYSSIIGVLGAGVYGLTLKLL